MRANRLLSAAVMGLAFGLWMASGNTAQAADPFTFQRLLIATSGDTPDACFHFNEPLDTRAEAHYGDYLKIEPPVTPAIRTTDRDLCVGGLAYGVSYKVTLRQGLPAQSGDRTGQDESLDVTLGDRAPLVAIGGDGFILPRTTSNGLAVQTVNVDHVKVHVLHVSPQLLRRARESGIGFNLAHAANDRLSYYQILNLLNNAATLTWSGTLDATPDHNRTVTTAFPLSAIVKSGEPGAYLVIAEPVSQAAPEHFFSKPPADIDYDDPDIHMYDQAAAHWLIATDVALTTLSGADGMHVTARALSSGQPLSGVKLTLLATDQDELGAGTTDGSGQAVFAPGLLKGIAAKSPSKLIAEAKDGDYTLLDLNRPSFDLSDRGVSGRTPPGEVQAFVYSDRGIYRPGESVEAMALLRDRVGASLDNMKLTLELRRPDGVEAGRFTPGAPVVGGFRQSIPLSKTAARGMWSLEAYVDPTAAPVGRVAFDVEDFVPQQLKVTLKADQPFLAPGQPVSATLDGSYLYGAPAAGLRAEGTVRLIRDGDPVPDAKGYSFGLVDEKLDDIVQPLDPATADANGHVQVAGTLKGPEKPVTTPLKAVISGGLFEPSGRPVQDRAELPVHTQSLLIGIKPRFADFRANEDADAIFDIRAFDADRHAVARQGLHWRLVRENHVYDWFSAGNGWEWHFHIVDQVVGSGTFDLTSSAPLALSQHVAWGDYRLIVDDPAAPAATSVRFSAGWAETADAADTPDKIYVSIDKPSVKAGDKVQLHIQGPFAGKAQITLASDRVFGTRTVDIPKDGATIALDASSDWGPGAYALVSMVRPLTQGGPHDPVRAVGVAWMALDTGPRTLTVAVAAPDKITPRRTIDVPIKVTGPVDGQTYVTLSAVDEGVLQLTRYVTPDPGAFLFSKVKLGLEMRDDYGRLLDGSAAAGPIHEGGDQGFGGAALPVISAKTVASFSGPVAIGPDGVAHIKLDIPDFEGQVRLMAVAYNHQAVGSGDAHMIVRDPVIADLSLPRFLAPGDSARLAVLLHNTDGVAGQYHLAVTADGAAKVAADHPLDFTLATGEQKFDAVTITGLDDGIANLHTDFTGPNGYAIHRDWHIAVRAAHYPLTQVTTSRQAPGDEFTLDPKMLAAFVPGSVTVSLGYAGFQGIDVPGLLQSLYLYPYGCTEQLVSTASPLLYYADPALLGHVRQDEPVHDRVQRAVDTIIDREDAAGSFGLWRANDGEGGAWLDVYAIDFLVRARAAGFKVPEAALTVGYSGLGRMLRSRDASASMAARAYADFVLARTGRADVGELRRTFDAAQQSQHGGLVYWKPNGKDDDMAQPLALGHLAAALTLMGDRARGRAAMNLAVAALDSPRRPGWWFDWTFYSLVRDLSGLVAIAGDMRDDQTAQRLAARLETMSANPSKLTTQDKAWLLGAAHTLSSDTTGRALALNGKAVSPLTLPKEFSPSIEEVKAGTAVRNAGDRELWRTLTVTGSPVTAPGASDAGYDLKRQYFTLSGQVADPEHLHQSDRVIVALSGTSDDDGFHRTALVDMLPAGWEIEGVVVKDTDYGFLGPLSKMQVHEARDDRFVAAFEVGKGQGPFYREVQDDDDDSADSDDDDSGKAKKKPVKPHLGADEFRVAYVARVITPGSFTRPEAVVEDMYRPGVMGRTDAGHAIVDQR